MKCLFCDNEATRVYVVMHQGGSSSRTEERHTCVKHSTLQGYSLDRDTANNIIRFNEYGRTNPTGIDPS